MAFSSLEIYFSRDHEWVRIQGDVGTVGITGHAARELGDITFVELPKVGSEVRQFDLLGSIESVKAASDIYAPVSGTVMEINQSLENAPEVINESAEEEGWIARIKLSDAGEVNTLLTEEQYRRYVNEITGTCP